MVLTTFWAVGGGAMAAENHPLTGPASSGSPESATKGGTELRPDLVQPYIVRKGDTLWDIARYFFKDPKKWLKIWEHNLYITNPDLIYPGNEIWFDAKSQRLTVRPKTAAGPNGSAPPSAAVTPPIASLPAGGVTGEQLFSIVINGEEQHETAHVLIDDKGRPALRTGDLRRWRLRVPAGAGVPHDGENYLPLDSIAGVGYSLDERTATLTISAEPEAFETTELQGRSHQPLLPKTATPGLFVNYDLTAQRVAGVRDMSGLFEAGVFGFGTLTSSMLGQRLNAGAQWTRLDTSWRFDQPAHMTTLQLGDAISHSGAWGRSVRFGGLQWGTNFATQPGFVPFALPVVAGETSLPSTVDLYINNVLSLRREVQPGPFEIYSPPAVTGSGQLQIVVRDLLGRQQVITQPYYAAPTVLAAGLHDYSYELGSVRKDFGLASNRYGSGFAALTHRYGFSDWFTGEGRAELLRDQQAVGLSGFLLWRPVGVFSLSLAGSHSKVVGRGSRVAVGFEHVGRPIGLRLSTELASRDFTQLGLAAGQLPPKRIDQAFASWTWNGMASVGIGYVAQRNYDQPSLELVTANFNHRLGRRWSLNFSASRDLRARSNSLFLTLTRSIGSRDSLSMAANAQGKARQASLEYQHSLPAGSGVGYRLRAYGGDTGGGEASLALQSDVGTYTAEAARQSHASATDVRLGARGGVALLDGRIFPSRYLDSSFGVVSVPGYTGVRVYAENQQVARTDAGGYAFVPRLRPYEKNHVRIELDDLPFDAQIDAAQLTAVPAWRSGTLIRFPVRPSRGVLLHLFIADNRPLPTDADVRIIGHEGSFPVGLGGEVYLTGVGDHSDVRVNWHGQQCEFSIAYPKDGGAIPDLGEFHCMGVKP